MQLRHLTINNFRGIRKLDWQIDCRLVLLVGPGDVCKSTILDAIGLALSPRWGHAFSDGDFYCGDVEHAIDIEVTVIDVDDSLLKEQTYGLWMRGIDEQGVIHDEPADDHEPAITIALTVDASLEPNWVVRKDAMGDERPISAVHRELIGAFQVDDQTAQHLRWTAGSALSHLTSGGDLRDVRTRAQRAARAAVFDAPDPAMQEAAERAGELAQLAGSATISAPRPGLEPPGVGRVPGLVLHDGQIPMTQLGRGSQRLATIAMQTHAVDASGGVLIDEVEVGLDPHRLLSLLSSLRARSKSGEGQVIMTTHSPLVIEAVEVDDLHIVRKTSDGVVTVTRVPHELEGARRGYVQGVARALPAALLAKRIVVCEGKTEVGLLRGLAPAWDVDEETPLALMGTCFVLGGGADSPRRARLLCDLGFEVLLLADDDLDRGNLAAWNALAAEAADAGVAVLRWPQGQAVEDQLFGGLPLAGVDDLIELRIESSDDPDNGAQSIRDLVADRLDCDAADLDGPSVADWQAATGAQFEDITSALADAAKAKSWFKNETMGRAVAAVLLKHLESVPSDSPLVTTLHQVRQFCYPPADPVNGQDDVAVPDPDAG